MVDEVAGQPIEQFGVRRRPTPCRPKFSGVATRPRPKKLAHSRLTNTRAVSGWSGSVNHLGQAQPISRRVGRNGDQHLRERIAVTRFASDFGVS